MSDELEARVDRVQRTQVFILAALLVLCVIVGLVFILMFIQTVSHQGVPLRVAL